MKRLICALVALAILVPCTAMASTGWWWLSIGDGLYVRGSDRSDYSQNDGWIYKRYRTCGHYGGCHCSWTYKKVAKYYGSPGSGVSAYNGYGTSATYNSIVGKLANMVADREKAQAQAQAQQLSHNHITELFEYFGLRNSLSGLSSYGALELSQGLGAGAYGSYGGYVQGSYAPYAQQGNTVYTSTVSQTNYPVIDVMAGLHSLERMHQYTAKAGDAIRSDFSDLVAQGLVAQSTAAQMAVEIARIQAAADVIRAAREDKVTHVQKTETFRQDSESSTGEQTEQPAQPQPQPDPTDGAMEEYQQAAEMFATILETKCANCHSGADPDGGLALEDYIGAGVEKQREFMVKVKKLVHTDDPGIRMPKNQEPLTDREKWAVDKVALSFGIQ